MHNLEHDQQETKGEGGREGTYQFVSSSIKCSKRGVTV